MASVQRTTPRSIFCSLQGPLELNRQPLHFLCLGTTFVWVNSAISSLWANLHDDWIKAIVQKSGTFHLLGGRTGLVVLWTFFVYCTSNLFLHLLLAIPLGRVEEMVGEYRHGRVGSAKCTIPTTMRAMVCSSSDRCSDAASLKQ